MADRSKREETSGNSKPGKSTREGLGDDQGTRVGGRGESGRGSKGRSGPSTQPVEEGLEGSILSTGKKRGKQGGGVGAGREGTQGLRSSPSRVQNERSGVSNASSSQSRPSGSKRPGSEPLPDTDKPHVSGYGGEGGKPKTSSDQREPIGEEPPGSARK